MKHQLIQDYIQKPLQEDPDRIAVTDERSSLTYGELNKLSSRLACCLLERGVRRQDRVVFSMKRSVNCLVAVLGILRADAVCVPVDHKAPEDRWIRVLRDCTPSAFICDESTAAQAERTSFKQKNISVIKLTTEKGSSFDEVSALDLDKLKSRLEQLNQSSDRFEDLAQILYTSGSTGQPKGVMITHSNIHNYISWVMEEFQITPEDRILGTAPFHFDMSTFDIFVPLLAGASLCIASETMTLFPAKLVKYMEEKEVTIWKGVSSLLMYLCRVGALKPGRIPALKKVLFAGESLGTKYLMEWMNTFPDKKFFNCYGPTETTGFSMYHQLVSIPESVESKIPIGKPCKSGTKIYLVNEGGTPAQKGETGEILIAGPCLSPGYLNDSEKTAQVFVSNPLEPESGEIVYCTGDLARVRDDGNYEFVGRKDNQVKIMGYRVELDDVEHGLKSVEGVDDGAVIVNRSGATDLNELCAYYVSTSGVDQGHILKVLKDLLPQYMVPKHLYRLDEIPRCERGKTSRKDLQSLLEEQDHPDGPD